MNPLFKGFLDACKPPDRRPPWKWAEEHIYVDDTSAMPGRWRSDNSPWSRAILDSLADPPVRRIDIKCCAQGAKSQTLICALFWAINEDPGAMQWVMASDDDVKDFVRDRIAPSMRSCAPVREKLISESVDDFVFSTCPVYFRGAGSPSKLQSKPIKWLFLDEVRNYPKGALTTVLKRTRSFKNGSKTIVVSTPGNEGDGVDLGYKGGNQQVFHVPCPKCGEFQPLEFSRLRWDTNATTKPGGKWDFDSVAPTIRYECRKCGHAIRDTDAERKRMCNSGTFVAMNPTAPRSRVSYHWNALLPWWVNWRDIVEEFLGARIALRFGDQEPMKTFVRETLGESWKDELGEIDDFGFMADRCGDWKMGDEWQEETTRFISADRQASGGEHYWFVVRAVGPAGKTRLISYGRAETKQELEEIRQTHSVPISNAVIDSGDGNSTAEIYRWCIATGWKPMKGDKTEGFIFRDPKSKRLVRRLWEISRVDPHIGSARAGRITIKLYRWSNPGVKDHLFDRITGTIPGWEIPKDTGAEYFRQMSAEHRVEIQDASGHTKWIWKQRRRDNHLLDCELMIQACILTAGLTAPAAKAVPPRAPAPPAAP